MRKGRVAYPPVTTVTDASERRNGGVTYLFVTLATEKGPAYFTRSQDLPLTDSPALTWLTPRGVGC